MDADVLVDWGAVEGAFLQDWRAFQVHDVLDVHHRLEGIPLECADRDVRFPDNQVEALLALRILLEPEHPLAVGMGQLQRDSHGDKQIVLQVIGGIDDYHPGILWKAQAPALVQEHLIGQRRPFCIAAAWLVHLPMAGAEIIVLFHSHFALLCHIGGINGKMVVVLKGISGISAIGPRVVHERTWHIHCP